MINIDDIATDIKGRLHAVLQVSLETAPVLTRGILPSTMTFNIVTDDFDYQALVYYYKRLPELLTETTRFPTYSTKMEVVVKHLRKGDGTESTNLFLADSGLQRRGYIHTFFTNWDVQMVVTLRILHCQEPEYMQVEREYWQSVNAASTTRLLTVLEKHCSKKATTTKVYVAAECVVCLDASPTHMFKCKHVAVCEKCSERTKKCPVCRAT